MIPWTVLLMCLWYSGVLGISNVYLYILSFGAESSVFQFATQKYKDGIVQNYKFARCFVWVRNLVDHIEGGT